MSLPDATDPKFTKIRDLVHQLNDFCCLNWRNPELYKTTEFWKELTAPDNYQLLLEWHEVLKQSFNGGQMNKTAAKFYADTLVESERRKALGA